MFWWLELGVSGPRGVALGEAARRAGHTVEAWDDGWWDDGLFPEPAGVTGIFHGSLANAARIAAMGRWYPGAYAQVDGYSTRAWLPAMAPWAAQTRYLWTTVADLLAAPEQVAGHLGDRVFVRPDSALKPFSGRVVTLAGLSGVDLDLGFYYDDLALPILVSELAVLGQEWRWTIARGQVVTGSTYTPARRQAGETVTPLGPEAKWAAKVAAGFSPPDPVYVLDCVETPGGLKVLEINPWSGADLYASDPDRIVAAFVKVVEG